MEIMKDLIVLNKYDPIKRYEKMICKESDGIKDLALKILISLNAIDLALQEYCNTDYHFYIKGDASIYCLLCMVYGTTAINEQDFEKAMVILDFSKLIYRFTCAKKFRENNDNLSQLRLNSWGRDYIYANSLEACNDFKEIKNCFTVYCKENIQLYRKLTKILLKKLDDEIITNIDKINSLIEVKLLS